MRLGTEQLTKLLLGAQNVEAGFVDDLDEEFKERVVVSVLEPTLVVELHRTAAVDIVAAPVHITLS